MQHAFELHDQDVAGADRVTDAVERGHGCRVEREIEGSELGKAARPLTIDLGELPRVRVEPGIRPVWSALRVDAGLHERQHRRMAFGGEVQPRERSGHDFRRGRFEIEEQAQRFGKIDIGEIVQDVAVDTSVEEPRQDGLPQQALPLLGLQIEHGARELAEHHSRHARVERAEECRDVAELPAQRLFAADLRRVDVVFSQPQEHARERRRILREERKIGERYLLVVRGRIDPHPALVRWIQVIDRAALRQDLFAASTLIGDQAREWSRRRADLDDLRTIRGAQGDAADAMLFQQIDEALLQAKAWVALNQVEAEPRKLPARSPALNRHLRDRGSVQPARELMLDHRPRPDANFVDDDLSRHHPEDKLFAVLEGQQRPLAGVDCRKADLTGGRIGMELLDGASQQQEKLVNRRGIRRAGYGARSRRAFGHGRTGSAQTCSPGIRSVIACACWDSHGSSFSNADSELSERVSAPMPTEVIAVAGGFRSPVCAETGKKRAAHGWMQSRTKDSCGSQGPAWRGRERRGRSHQRDRWRRRRGGKKTQPRGPRRREPDRR